MNMKLILGAVSSAALLATPVMAAEDMRFGSDGTSVAYRGMGVQARLVVPLGGQRAPSSGDRTSLELSAGPSFLRTGTQSRTSKADISRLASVRIEPGYSAKLNMAGFDVATRYTKLGLAEQQRRDALGADARGVSTLGWVGIGVGAVLAAALVAGAIIFHCPKSQECGSD